MNEQIRNRWNQDWAWVLASMERKGAETWDGLEIGPPASQDQIRELQQVHGLLLPDEFVEVVTNYSAAVTFDWSLYDVVRPPGIYRGIHGGGAIGEAPWSTGRLLSLSQSQARALDRLEEIEEEMAAEHPEFVPERIWHNKTFFIHVPNGDYIAFDVAHGTRNCPVVYLDHEWGDFNGRRLGLNFVDFMTRWSNLGCPGVESWNMRPFYDPTQDLLMDSGEIVDDWKRWVSE